ncbi:unnamed protein product [Caenorhabditis auriculariae]|uniref:Choline/carnitine acyltransferase domain-containing protein n=1 Tax=Caenorhabditis auriculariae TaxID=2777116 RepID=A0A8S1HF31_9PELO|nr:unnamed protein product [Caenorhabditis auriculariae]
MSISVRTIEAFRRWRLREESLRLERTVEERNERYKRRYGESKVSTSTSISSDEAEKFSQGEIDCKPETRCGKMSFFSWIKLNSSETELKCSNYQESKNESSEKKVQTLKDDLYEIVIAKTEPKPIFYQNSKDSTEKKVRLPKEDLSEMVRLTKPKAHEKSKKSSTKKDIRLEAEVRLEKSGATSYYGRTGKLILSSQKDQVESVGVSKLVDPCSISLFGENSLSERIVSPRNVKALEDHVSEMNSPSSPECMISGFDLPFSSVDADDETLLDASSYADEFSSPDLENDFPQDCSKFSLDDLSFGNEVSSLKLIEILLQFHGSHSDEIAVRHNIMVGTSKLGSPFSLPSRFPSTFERKSYLVYNWLDNRLWPVRPIPFTATCAALLAYNLRYPTNVLLSILPSFESPHLEILKACAVSVSVVYVPTFILRKALKYFYFSYKGFLFENPKKPSLRTKAWGFVRYLLSFVPRRLESCDRLLPNLPVPPLQQTIRKYLDSSRNLMPKDEFELVVEQAEAFLLNEGRSLQTYAWIYSMFTDNYVTPFWEKYAYLYSRAPVLINSSVAHCDLIKVLDMTCAYRAARIIWIEMMSQLAIDRQDYKALGDGLLCTRHYKKMYAVTRVPGESIDHLANYGIQNYLVVELHGFLYKVRICDHKNRIYSVEKLTQIFAELLARNETEEGPFRRLVALTHDTRDSWHRNRKRFFLDNAVNRKALDTIEKAALFMTLDEDDTYGYDPENPEKLSNFLLNMLCGDGTNRWADKSLNYIAAKNSRAGGTTEHSIADGAEFDHIMENYIHLDAVHLEILPREEQIRLETITDSDRKELILGEKLVFEVADKEMVPEINRCYETHQAAKADIDVFSLIFRDFGKGRIKKCGVSPDAFVQMAIQLANYRDQGRFVLTYEPASVRFFANSRTETLRTVSDQSCQFVLAMLDPNETNEHRIELLQKACTTHVEKNKDCMVGGGIDRHLFVLYILSKATGTSSAFLDHYISQPWLLSTSHVPNVTNQIDEDSVVDHTWLGACFGPVAKQGYGVCYRFGGNHTICANITSHKSASNTDSALFGKRLAQAFHDISALFN